MNSVASFLAPEGWLSEDRGPRYLQLQKRLEAAIAGGVLRPDSPLPPERELATRTGLSRVTVRKAMQALVDKGVIVQRQGSGSFVAGTTGPRVEQSLSRLTSFSEDMARRGIAATARWLRRGVFYPSPEEVVALGLSSGDSVARVERLRIGDGRPLAIERAALPLDILPDPGEVRSSLYEALGERGVRPVRALQKISAVNTGAEDARLLDLAEGAAGLRIERTAYLPSGRAVEFTRSLYRGDAYDFVAELRIVSRQDST